MNDNYIAENHRFSHQTKNYSIGLSYLRRH